MSQLVGGSCRQASDPPPGLHNPHPPHDFDPQQLPETHGGRSEKDTGSTTPELLHNTVSAAAAMNNTSEEGFGVCQLFPF